MEKTFKVRFTKRGRYPSSRGTTDDHGNLIKIELTEGLELKVPEKDLIKPWFIPVDKKLRRKWSRKRKQQMKKAAKAEEASLQKGMTENQLAQMELTGRAIEFTRE